VAFLRPEILKCEQVASMRHACALPAGLSGAIQKERESGVDLGNAMPPPTDRKPGIALFLDGVSTTQTKAKLKLSLSAALK
jgi:hypothetical protein